MLYLVEFIIKTICVLCLVAQSCLTLCDPMDCIQLGFSVHGDSPGMNTRVCCHSLLQGISPTQKSNPGLPHCRPILYCLSHQEKPKLSLGFFDCLLRVYDYQLNLLTGYCCVQIFCLLMILS